MSDESDAAHEWIHSIHTSQLKAKVESRLHQRLQMLISQCAVTVDPKIIQAHGEYMRLLLLKDLLEKGDL